MIHLGDRQWSWVHRSEVLPFDRHAKAKLQEAEAAIAIKKLTKPCVFRKAMEVRCLPGNAAGSRPGALTGLQFCPGLPGSAAGSNGGAHTELSSCPDIPGCALGSCAGALARLWSILENEQVCTLSHTTMMPELAVHCDTIWAARQGKRSSPCIRALRLAQCRAELL